MNPAMQTLRDAFLAHALNMCSDEEAMGNGDSNLCAYLVEQITALRAVQTLEQLASIHVVESMAAQMHFYPDHMGHVK